MTAQEMTRELEARYAREYLLIREADHCDSDTVEKLIEENAARIDWLQAHLSQVSADA